MIYVHKDWTVTDLTKEMKAIKERWLSYKNSLFREKRQIALEAYYFNQNSVK